jgi:thiamine pyrophosphokinase
LETDHFLGNLMLGRKLARGAGKLNLHYVSSRQQLFYLQNDRIRLKDMIGSCLSVVPLSNRIAVTLRGARFPAKKLTILAGDTIGLRNEVVSGRADASIIGSALIIVTKK